MSKTMIDIVRLRAEKFSSEVCHLINNFSRLSSLNNPADTVYFISVTGNFVWQELSPEGKRLQAKLLPEIERLIEIITTLTDKLPERAKEDIKYNLGKARDTVEQNGTTWWKTPEEACNGFQMLIHDIMAFLFDYFGNTNGKFIAIADTNALLTYPDIENWYFDGISQFELILTPTILSELDKLKIHHKNENVRDKANKLIRKVKEYRRRGTLTDGIPVVQGRIFLRSIAVEPNMSRTLSWLDSSNADDRFLTTAIEIIRENMSSEVFIVTGDMNMQNKAEFAGIPYREIPEN